VIGAKSIGATPGDLLSAEVSSALKRRARPAGSGHTTLEPAVRRPVLPRLAVTHVMNYHCYGYYLGCLGVSTAQGTEAG